MLWVPIAGTGGVRYRDTLAVLRDEELVTALDLAVTGVSDLAHSRGVSAAVLPWVSHGGALVCYALWAVYGARDRGLILADGAERQIDDLAQWQYGIAGRPRSWECPAWWGGEVHGRHLDALCELAPSHYGALVDASSGALRGR